MIDLLILPFQLPFMQKAFLIAALAALPMGLLSPFLVLKGWSLMGDAISHAVLPGIVLAYIVGLPLAIGAFTAGMICALATGYLKENSRVKEDTVMGVVFSGMFGLGIVLYIGIQTDIHLDHILFGDMLGVYWRDIAESAVIALLVLATAGVMHRDLMAMTFDELHARAIGLPVRFLHYGLLALISLTIVGALKAVGIILAIALLISPGAIAGVYASFFLDSAPAPTIVLLMSLQFIAAFGWSQWRIRRATRYPTPT